MTHSFVLFISALADLIQKIHVRGRYEKFNMKIDARGILAFSLLMDGIFLENAHSFFIYLLTKFLHIHIKMCFVIYLDVKQFCVLTFFYFLSVDIEIERIVNLET